jgi:hypothetical protein
VWLDTDHRSVGLSLAAVSVVVAVAVLGYAGCRFALAGFRLRDGRIAVAASAAVAAALVVAVPALELPASLVVVHVTFAAMSAARAGEVARRALFGLVALLPGAFVAVAIGQFVLAVALLLPESLGGVGAVVTFVTGTVVGHGLVFLASNLAVPPVPARVSAPRLSR